MNRDGNVVDQEFSHILPLRSRIILLLLARLDLVQSQVGGIYESLAEPGEGRVEIIVFADGVFALAGRG